MDQTAFRKLTAPRHVIEQGASAEGVAVEGLPGRKRQAAQAVIYFGTTAAVTRAGKDTFKELLNKLRLSPPSRRQRARGALAASVSLKGVRV